MIQQSNRLKYTEPQTGVQSKLGGNPDLPGDYVWPENVKGKPLSFLCQLNLSLVTSTKSDDDQLLHFFVDVADLLLDDNNGIDKSRWKVSSCKIADVLPTAAPKELPPDEIFAERQLQTIEEQTFPSF